VIQRQGSYQIRFGVCGGLIDLPEAQKALTICNTTLQTDRIEAFKGADNILSCVLHKDSNAVQKEQQDAFPSHYITPL